MEANIWCLRDLLAVKKLESGHFLNSEIQALGLLTLCPLLTQSGDKRHLDFTLPDLSSLIQDTGHAIKALNREHGCSLKLPIRYFLMGCLMNETEKDALTFMLASLREGQDIVRAYDTKAQIVGVGYIFAIGIIVNLGARIANMPETGAPASRLM